MVNTWISEAAKIAALKQAYKKGMTVEAWVSAVILEAAKNDTTS